MRLKALREAKNLSQYRLAKLTGVSQAYISKMEREGAKSAGGEVLRRLSKPLCCTIEDLLEDEPEHRQAI